MPNISCFVREDKEDIQINSNLTLQTSTVIFPADVWIFSAGNTEISQEITMRPRIVNLAMSSYVHRKPLGK